MNKGSYFLVIALAIALLPSKGQSAAEFKGYMFGEYYYVANHHSHAIDGRHGFWFRRIYFTYNNKLTNNIKMRLRFEMNSPGDFKSSDNLTAVVKDAYLSYKTGAQVLMFGIVSTPTWDHNVEKVWGYRSVEKTPLDLLKMGSSRDFGVGLKGLLNEAQTVSYMFLFGNGAANKGETDRGKKVYASLAFKPVEGLTLEAYGDYEAQKENKTYYVIQGFGSYEGDWVRIGAMYARRHFKQDIAGGDDKKNDYDIFSAFAVVKAAKDVEIIARYDRMFGDGFENNFKGHKISYVPFADNPRAPFNLVIGGISWQAAKNVWLIPNIKYVFYEEPDIGEKPSEDVYANMTIWFKF